MQASSKKQLPNFIFLIIAELEPHVETILHCLRKILFSRFYFLAHFFSQCQNFVEFRIYRSSSPDLARELRIFLYYDWPSARRNLRHRIELYFHLQDCEESSICNLSLRYCLSFTRDISIMTAEAKRAIGFH